MKSVCYIIVLGAFFLLQTTLSNFIWIFGIKPDLPLVFALCIAVVNGEKAGAAIGLLNGFLEDIFFWQVYRSKYHCKNCCSLPNRVQLP